MIRDGGVDVQVVCPGHSQAAEYFRREGFVTHELPLKGVADWASARGLRGILENFRPDIVHAHSLVGCWLAIAAQTRQLRPSLIPYRGTTRRPNRWNPVDYRIFFGPRVDTFMCNCKAVADELGRSGVPSETIAAIPYGHRLEWYEGGKVPAGMEATGRFRIGSLSNVRRVKGLDVLINAADLLEERGVDFELYLVGRDDRRELTRYLRRSGCRDRIRVTGFVPDPWGLLRTFDCAVLPSRNEGLSRAGLESMACGVPLVASEVGGTRDLVEDGENGLLVPPEDPRALADAIQRVYEDGQLRKVLAENGRRTLKTRFNIDQTYQALLALYARVLDHPSDHQSSFRFNRVGCGR